MRRTLLFISFSSCQLFTGIDPSATLADAGSDQKSAEACAEVCGGKCVSLASSSQHCGACGRSCGGGACENGVCLPLLLADEDPGMTCILAVRDHIVFGLGGNYMNPDTGDLFSVPKDASEPPQRLAAATGTCGDLDFDGTTLVLNTGNKLLRLDEDGSNRAVLHQGSNQRALAARDGEVYWYERHNGVFHVPRAGGTVVGPIDPAPGKNGSTVLFVTDPYVYFGDDTADIIVRVSRNGSEPNAVVAQPQSLYRGFQAKDTFFITNGSYLQIFRDDDAGAPLSSIGAPLGTAVAVVADDQDVFVGDAAGFGANIGAIYRYRRASGEWSVFVDRVRYPNHFTLDRDFFYYTVVPGDSKDDAGQTNRRRQLFKLRR